MGNPIHLLAFGFGSGLSPVAPGTFGTLVALPIYLWMQNLTLGNYVLVVFIMTVFGVWLCQVTANNLGVHDHQGIVWDEIVGYLITMTAAPFGWVWMIIGFILFRFFDIVKPWPIKWVDKKVDGGIGIMFDDILAGIFAFLVLQLLVIGLVPYY